MVLALLLAVVAAAGPAPLTPAARAFTMQDGLPSNTIEDIATDRDGRLWISTQAGVVRYDGRGWKKATTLADPRTRFAPRLAPAQDGGMWIATAGTGLLHVYDEATEHFDSRAGLPGDDTKDVIDCDGVVAVATARGVAVRRGATFVSAAFAGTTVLSCGLTKAELLVGTERGVFALDVSTLTLRPIGTPLTHITAIRVIDEVAWIGAMNGACKWNGQRATALDELDDTQIADFALHVNKRGERGVWIATYQRGLALLTKDALAWYPPEVSFASQFVRALATTTLRGKETTRHVWLGTQDGLMRLTLGAFQRFTTNALARDGHITAAAELEARVWIATDEPALLVNDGDRWDQVPIPTGKGNIDALALTKHDDHEDVIAGTFNGEVHMRHDGAWRSLSLPKTKGNTAVFAMAEMSETLWVGGWERFARRDASGWHIVEPEPPGLPTNTILALTLASSSTGTPQLWAGTYAGLSVFDQGRWRAFSQKDGFPAEHATNVVRRGRELWVATSSGLALAMLDGDTPSRWQLFTTQTTPALPNDFVTQVGASSEGDIYAFTDGGMARLTREKEAHLARTFTVEDGLPANEHTQGASLVDRHGRVFAGTVKGLAMLDPREELVETEPAHLRFVTVKSGENVLSADAARRLGYDQNIVFDYALLHFFREDETRYRTQLVGVEREPGKWVAETTREFLGLAAGSYELRVWAKDYSGVESGPLRHAFVIAPPPWQTWWAYTGYALVVAGAAVLGMRARIAQLRRRGEELERIVLERTEEVRKQADEIRLQKEALEASYAQADRIFAQLKEALKGSLLDDRYRLEQEIGQGGFGVVYRASEVRTGKVYAVKVFRPSAGNDSVEALERFKQEARSAQRVNHENAIVVHEAGVSKDNIAYTVMELLHGKSLKELLRERGKLDLALAEQVSVATCNALAAAHALGIIHRDIKPDNVFLHEQDGRVIPKVLDFGVAKVQQGTKSMAIATLTMTGAVVGTPTYMAPERLEDHPYDGRSDVYSLGVMLYEMLSGRPPFASASDNIFSLVMQHLKEAPRPIAELDPSLPPLLQDAVMHALVKDPSTRPSAAAYALELTAAFASARG